MIEVMVTQTWAWIQQQLDFPRYKWIKIHALRPYENISYCGLENHTDVGVLEEGEFIKHHHACQKCVKAIEILILD